MSQHKQKILVWGNEENNCLHTHTHRTMKVFQQRYRKCAHSRGVCVCVCVCTRTQVHAHAQSCPTLCHPMGCVAHQALLSMSFSRQEYWSGLPFPSPGVFPTQIKPTSLESLALAGRFFTICIMVLESVQQFSLPWWGKCWARTDWKNPGLSGSLSCWDDEGWHRGSE